jgi:hypothetical protein
MILAAQYVGDLHQRIVHGIGEEKLRRAIGPADHEIADIVAGETLRATDQIGEFDRPPHAARESAASVANPVRAERPLHLGQTSAGTGVARRPTGRQLGFAAQRQLGRRAKARIDPLRGFQPLVVSRIDRPALRLRVGLADRRSPAPPASPAPASANLPARPRRIRGGCAPGRYPRCAAEIAPPMRRASSALNSAVRTFPRCRSPVGLGANRVLTSMVIVKSW